MFIFSTRKITKIINVSSIFFNIIRHTEWVNIEAWTNLEIKEYQLMSTFWRSVNCA